MKKQICRALLLCLAACVLMAGWAGCGEEKTQVPAPTQSGPVVGAYGEDREITPEDMEVYNEAMEGFVGVSYDLISVAVQVVAGLNYRFRAVGTPAVLNPEPFDAYIYIYQPLEGPPELTDIERIGVGEP